MTAPDGDDDIGSLVQQTLSLLSQEGDHASFVKDLPSDSPRDTDTDDLAKLEPASAAAQPLVSPAEEEADVPLGSGPPSPAGRMLSMQLDSVGLSGQLAPEITEEAPADTPGGSSDLSQRVQSLQDLEDQQQARTANGEVRIWVKDIEKLESVTALGRWSHHVYTIRMDSTVPGLVASGMEVRRRFSEFDTLHKLLHAEFRGLFIPPLPPKTLIDHKIANDEFLRLRRADLQAFLRAIVAHPDLQQAEATRVFMLQPGELATNPAWISLVTRVQQKRAAMGSPSKSGVQNDTSDALGLAPHNVHANGGQAALANIGNWVSWVKHNTLAVFQPPRRVLPPEEVDLRQSKELLQDLERLLQLATVSARSMCRTMEKLCQDHHEFGRNMGMLSKFEEAVLAKVGTYTPEGRTASGRAADCRKVAMCEAKQHGVHKVLSVKTAANFMALHDHYLMVPEAIAAMEAREEALDHVFSLEEERAHMQHQLESLQQQSGTPQRGLLGMRALGNASGLGSSEKRSYLLSQNIAVLDDQIKLAKEQYAIIAARNRSELVRLGLEREADFRRMIASFAATQASLVQSSADLWASLSKQFGSDPPESSLAGTSAGGASN